MSILTTKHLDKVYEGKVPYTALNDINFSVEKGKFATIMGPSGSGKSTLLNVISTIDHPTSGSVYINSEDPHKMNDDQLAHFRRNTLGFVFQDFNLVHTLTVGENIMLAAEFNEPLADQIFLSGGCFRFWHMLSSALSWNLYCKFSFRRTL